MHLHKQAAFIYPTVTGRRVPQLVGATLNIWQRRPPVVITHNTKMRRMTVNSSQALQRLFGTGMILLLANTSDANKSDRFLMY